MTYTAGSTIVDSDYNGFATDTDTVWGVGSATNGYGQTNTVGTVAAGATITATQWATLLTRIASAASHQGTTITAIGNPTVGDTIAAYAALSTNISAINNNNAAASGSDSSATTTTTSAWIASATTSKTVTFASADQMRYFFNSGGMIRIGFARSGGTVSDQNTAWTTLLTAAGTIVLTGAGAPGPTKTIAATTYEGTTKIGGSGTPTTLAESVGAYNLNGTSQTLYKQFATTYTYTSNYVEITATATATVITFAVTLIDVDGTGGGYIDSIDGTLDMTTTIRQPSTTYISNTWGTITQNAATWSLT
jgi:hypothetical protein